jgi:hypothetical protein
MRQDPWTFFWVAGFPKSASHGRIQLYRVVESDRSGKNDESGRDGTAMTHAFDALRGFISDVKSEFSFQGDGCVQEPKKTADNRVAHMFSSIRGRGKAS